MNPDWQTEFRQRMAVFKSNQFDSNKFASSIMVRVTTGCFHREYSPRAYEVIDSYPRSEQVTDASIEEHESGLEVLAWVAVTTAGISLTAAAGHPVGPKEVEKVLLKALAGRVAKKPAKAKRKHAKKLNR